MKSACISSIISSRNVTITKELQCLASLWPSNCTPGVQEISLQVSVSPSSLSIVCMTFTFPGTTASIYLVFCISHRINGVTRAPCAVLSHCLSLVSLLLLLLLLPHRRKTVVSMFPWFWVPVTTMFLMNCGNGKWICCFTSSSASKVWERPPVPPTTSSGCLKVVAVRLLLSQSHDNCTAWFKQFLLYCGTLWLQSHPFALTFTVPFQFHRQVMMVVISEIEDLKLYCYFSKG